MSHSAASGDDEGVLSEINVSPLVDVMLVLLIVFMITVPAMVASAPIRVELPETSSISSDGISADLLPAEITVKRDESGKVVIFVDDRSYTEETIAEVVPLLLQASETEPVKLSADRSLGYDDVVHVIDVLYSHGVRKLGLSTKPVGAVKKAQ